jgi:predicted aspartyl protease
MKRYGVDRKGNALVVRAALEGEHEIQVVQLMVDTGATHTILQWRRLQELGYDPAASRDWRRILTVDSTVMVPRVRLQRLHCLGKVVENLPVLCHMLPFVTYVDGLLGIDFLRSFDIAIHTRRGYIEVA